ncbi:hypothetical protein B6590_09320 [Campylobacter jejuni]|nr:hypothetical protein [Campylobacter jejuni]EAL0921410.1 hypothetical protein [Campylobacter jejuni]
MVILPNDVLQLNSILGNEILLPQRKFIENPLPMIQTTIAVKKSEQREILLGALTEISDCDPLLKYYVDTTTHEIILSFLGNVQMEVICAILEEKYHVEAEIKEPTVIYMERPLRKAEYTIHIEVPPNPFWASVGLSIEPLPIGSGVQYESRVSLGYLNQSFQNAVMEGVLYGCEQGLYGWKVTDCKICFEYGLYLRKELEDDLLKLQEYYDGINVLEYKTFALLKCNSYYEKGRINEELIDKIKKYYINLFKKKIAKELEEMQKEKERRNILKTNQELILKKIGE